MKVKCDRDCWHCVFDDCILSDFEATIPDDVYLSGGYTKKPEITASDLIVYCMREYEKTRRLKTVAKAVGVSDTAIRKWLTAKCVPTDNVLLKINPSVIAEIRRGKNEE